MKLKTYHCDSLQAAMRLAKIELGDDAVLVGSRDAVGRHAEGARLAVTFAVAPSSAARTAPAPAAPGVDEETARLLLDAVSKRRTNAREPQSELRRRPAVSKSKDPKPAGVRMPHWRRYAPSAEPETEEARPSPPSPKTQPALVGRQRTYVLSETEALKDLSLVASEIRELLRGLEKASAARDAGDTALLRDGRPEGLGITAELYRELTASELDPALAAQLVDGLEQAARPGAGREGPLALLEERLERLLQVDSRVGLPGETPAVAALVGPPGCGKTSCLTKLAVTMHYEQKLRVHLISADHTQVGSVETLEAYAFALGAPITVLDDSERLAEEIERVRSPVGGRAPDVVLIDTPGYSAGEWGRAKSLAAALDRAGRVDIHLAVSAASKAADLKEVMERFSLFKPRKLLLTRLDETSSHGAAISESIARRLPISFLSNGRRVPEDWAAAAKPDLARLVRRERGF